MPFDGLVLAAIQHELTQKIMGSKIDKIYQPAPEEIHLLLHKPEGRSRLLLSANASMARIHWTNKTKENPSNRCV